MFIWIKSAYFNAFKKYSYDKLLLFSIIFDISNWTLRLGLGLRLVLGLISGGFVEMVYTRCLRERCRQALVPTEPCVLDAPGHTHTHTHTKTQSLACSHAC